ncbi:MAG TPA: hypothetical protein PKE26_03550 [Kiritimatiellia bacterium]|nr:hypothetical protein [Kiritimatiellia bacterium]HMO98165.1 hypothetical protein [Kiritimatiellia bacterium]HMP96677.1 hypothetical protein [Kiritimatiellia bacterium]
MGTPYTTTASSGIAPNAGRFDTSNARLHVVVNGIPSNLVYALKGNPSSGTAINGIFEVLESTDGEFFTPVQVIVNKNNAWVTYTNELSSQTRHVLFRYTSKTNGNIAIDDVRIEGAPPASEPEAPSLPIGAFTVMAANLSIQPSASFSYYDDSAGRLFQGLQPDIVAIQEFTVTNTGGHRAFVDQHFGTNYHFFVESTDGDTASPMPNGIISRWPLIAAGEWEDVNISNRDFAWATVELPGSGRVHVVSVHLKAGSTESDIDRRILQAHALTNLIHHAFGSNDYIILAGDLNCSTRNEPALRILTNIFNDVRQPADRHGNRNTNRAGNRPFDFVLANQAVAAYETPLTVDGVLFPDGLIFIDNQWDILPHPILAGDSYAPNRQHMPVMKRFAIDVTFPPPLHPPGELVFFDFEDNGGLFVTTPDRIHPNLASASSYTSDDGTVQNVAGICGRGISDTGWQTGLRHYTFTVEVAAGFQASITGMQFFGRSSGTGPIFWYVVTSHDHYATPLATGEQLNDSLWSRHLFSCMLGPITGAVTLRVYGLDASAGAGTWAHDTVKLFGSVTPITPPEDDVNGNGIPDAWEFQFFGRLLSPGETTLDSDGDGLSNWAEFLAGTDPTDAASGLFVEAHFTESGHILVSWNSVTGRAYRIERAEALTGTFTPITEGAIPATPPVNSHLDVSVPTHHGRLYRIRLE